MADPMTWSDEYEAAPSGPHPGSVIRDADEPAVRALGRALKRTGKPLGAASAAAMAGVVLAALRAEGWEMAR